MYSIIVTNARSGEHLGVFPFSNKSERNMFKDIFVQVCKARINGMGKPNDAVHFVEDGALVIGERIIWDVLPMVTLEYRNDDRDVRKIPLPDIVRNAAIEANRVMDMVDE